MTPEQESTLVELLRAMVQCYEEDTGFHIDECDQDSTQYAGWEFLAHYPPNAGTEARVRPSPPVTVGRPNGGGE